VTLVCATSAPAASALEPELRYEAPAACPSSAEFAALVAARTRFWLAPQAPFAVTVAIQQVLEGEGFAGELTLLRAGRHTTRNLSAAHCDELARALALIVAILIDPQAAEQAPPGVPAASAARAPEPQPRFESERPVAPWFVAGPEVVLQTALTHDLTFGGRIFFGVGRGDTALWLSSARLSASRVAGHASSPLSGARAEFELYAARLDGCVVRAVLGVLSLEPCVFFDAGRLRATGLHSTGNVTRAEPWVTAGVLLRPSLTLARHVVLEAGLGFHVPLTRYRFAFTGEPALHETAVFGFDGALGLAVRFP
jgi:hypothetical protein